MNKERKRTILFIISTPVAFVTAIAAGLMLMTLKTGKDNFGLALFASGLFGTFIFTYYLVATAHPPIGPGFLTGYLLISLFINVFTFRAYELASEATQE